MIVLIAYCRVKTCKSYSMVNGSWSLDGVMFILTCKNHCDYIPPMLRVRTRLIAIGLAACLLILSGVMYPQTVAHAAHHAHHKAATHSTALCTWMCAAGQAQEHVSYNFKVEIEVVSLVDNVLAQQPIELDFIVPTTRGPPSFFL